ncbi:hypothetical protein AB6H14_06700 [Providencia vermicola]
MQQNLGIYQKFSLNIGRFFTIAIAISASEVQNARTKKMTDTLILVSVFLLVKFELFRGAG